MISELSWETLEQRRAKTRAVLMYKIINNLVDIPSHTLLIPPDGRTRGTTVYRVIYTRIDAYKYSFFPRTILLTWSHISQELRLVSTIDQFRAYYNNCVFESDMVNKTEWLVDYRFCHPPIWRLQVPVLYMLLHVHFTNMCHVVVIKLICYLLLAMLQAVLCIKVVKTSSRPYYFFKVLSWLWSYGSWIYNYLYVCNRCRHDRMVVGFTTIYAISAYHH